jgi:hypothetical protein
MGRADLLLSSRALPKQATLESTTARLSLRPLREIRQETETILGWDIALSPR